MRDAHLTMAKRSKGQGKSLQSALIGHVAREALIKQKQQKEENRIHQKTIKSKSSKQTNSGQIRKPYIPFQQDETVLLVGEGDFSFAVSLIEEKYVSPSNLIATSYDTKEQVEQKYVDGLKNITFLEEQGVQVHFSIDGTALLGNFKPTKKSVLKLFNPPKPLNHIMFNFPHTGKGVKDMARNVRDHQRLVDGYFKSANELLSVHSQLDLGGYAVEPSTSVILSVFEGEPYVSWGIKALARGAGLKVERSGAFIWEAFPSYHHKRTNSMRDTTKPAAERPARIYSFVKYTKKE